jgi:heat shock protein HtpX
MNLKLSLVSILALTFLFGLIYAIVFAISIWFLPFNWISLVIMVGFALGMILMQYAISPYILQWVYRIDWMPYEEYKMRYPHLAEVLDKVVGINNIKMPKLGIIHDMNPNAFTFGHTKNSARVILTDGILEFLDEKEQQAVLAHELGHVVHQDFILMTLVFAIPMVFLTIARWAYYASIFSRGRRGEEGAYWRLALIAIAILSFIFYYVGYLISLFVSRVREYYADEHSAEVLEDPNALSTGLVKIAYGLISDQGVTIKERDKSKVRGVKGLGIFDPNMARSLAMQSMSAKGMYSRETIEGAAAWDLFNPWARFYQLRSSHPLPARRIQRLNEQCAQYNIEPAIDFSNARKIKEEQAGKSMIGEFLTDLLFKYLPLFIFLGFGVFTIIWLFSYLEFYSLPLISDITSNQLLFLWALAFYLMAIGYIIKVQFAYRSGFELRTVLNLISSVKVSPVRCIPATIEGQIIGKGAPGYYLSDDLYFKDDTGLLYIDYRFGLGIADLIWAIRRADRMVGQWVRIKGWFRRGPIPYFQVKEIETESGRTFKNYRKQLSYIWAVLLFIVGIILLLVWIF